MYHFGLLLCNVPQGHDCFNVDYNGQSCSCGAVGYGQDLCDRLNADGKASISQNLQEQDEFLDVVL